MANERTFDPQPSLETEVDAVQDFETGKASEELQSTKSSTSNSGNPDGINDNSGKSTNEKSEIVLDDFDLPENIQWKQVVPEWKGTLKPSGKIVNENKKEYSEAELKELQLEGVEQQEEPKVVLSIFEVSIPGGWYKVKFHSKTGVIIGYAQESDIEVDITSKVEWFNKKIQQETSQKIIVAERKKQIDTEIKTREAEYYKNRKSIPESLQDVNTQIEKNTLQLQTVNEELDQVRKSIVDLEIKINETEELAAVQFKFAKPSLDQKKYDSISVKIWRDTRDKIDLLNVELNALQTVDDELNLKQDQLAQEQQRLSLEKEYFEKGQGIEEHNKNIKQRSKLDKSIKRKESSLQNQTDRYARKIRRKERNGKLDDKQTTQFGFERRIGARIKKKEAKLKPEIDKYNLLNQQVNEKRQSFLSGDLSKTRDEFKIKSIDQNPEKKHQDFTGKNEDVRKKLTGKTTVEPEKKPVSVSTELTPSDLARATILKYSTEEKAESEPPMVNAEVVAVFYYLINAKDLNSEELDGIRWYMEYHINDSNIYDIFGYTEDKIDPETFLKKIKGNETSIKGIYGFFKRLIQDKRARKEDPSSITKTGNKKKRKEDRERKQGVTGNYRIKSQLSDMSGSIGTYKKEVKKVENLKPEKRHGDINAENHYVFSMMKFHKHFYLDTFQLYAMSSNVGENDKTLREFAENYYNNYLGSYQSDPTQDKTIDANFETFFSQLKATNGVVLYQNFMEYLENGIPANPQRVYEDYMAYLHPLKLGALQKDVYDLRHARTKKTGDRLLKGLQVDYRILLPQNQNTPIALYETVFTLQQEWATIGAAEKNARLYPIYQSLGGTMNETDFSQNLADGKINLADILTRTVPKEYIKGGKVMHPEQAYHDFFITLLNNTYTEVLAETGVSEFIKEHAKTIGFARNIAMALLNSINNENANFQSLENFANYLDGWVFNVTAFKAEWGKESVEGETKFNTDLNFSSRGKDDGSGGSLSSFAVAKTNEGAILNLNPQFGIKNYRWVDGKQVETFSLQSGAYLQNQWFSGNTTDPDNLKFSDISQAMLRQNTLIPKYDRNKHESPSLTSGFQEYYSGRPKTTFSRATLGADLALKKNFYLNDLIIGLSGGGSYQFNQYSGTLVRELPLLPLETKVQTQVITGKLGLELMFNNGLGFNFAYTGTHSAFQGDAFENGIPQEDMSKTSSQYVQKASMTVSYNGINGVFNIGNDTKGTYLDLKFGTDLNLLFPGLIDPGSYEIELLYNHTTWNQNPELKIPSNSINLFGIRLIKKL